MLNLGDPIAVMLAASAAFDRAGLEAAAYGGLVVAMYGRARETQDADLATVNASVDGAQEALAVAGLTVVRTFTEVAFGGCTLSRLTLIGDGEFNTIDLVRPRSERYRFATLGRALTGTLRGETLRVVSPEGTVLLKVLTTRERDLEDAQSAVQKHRDGLDLALLEREVALFAREIADHDVTGRYRRVMAGA